MRRTRQKKRGVENEEEEEGEREEGELIIGTAGSTKTKS
jgi:hypothetical protein